MHRLILALLALLVTLPLQAAQDASPKIQFITVAKDVDLEVLDWGGSGPPLVFLPGLGATAHGYGDLAQKFTGQHRVYGITRRGFGASSRPAPTDDNYDIQRLADDVLAVIDALKLERPVLAGHSMAGAEMSSIGTRHPEKVSGLIYLDAAYGYAFHHPEIGPPRGGVALAVEIAAARRDLRTLLTASPGEANAIANRLAENAKDMQAYAAFRLKHEQDKGGTAAQAVTAQQEISQIIRLNWRKFGAVQVPILALVAVPGPCAPTCNDLLARANDEMRLAQADALDALLPNARVVKIAGADHYIYRSHEEISLREMNLFLERMRKERAS